MPEKASDRIAGASRDGYAATPYFADGWLGLALERAITVPTATAAPIRSPTLIMKDRVRFWRAGAIAAPDGLDAATPVPGS
jgi:hypothetical protein